MSIEKVLQTRIINKHGTYSEWSSSDITLKEGEIALVKFTTKQQATDENGNITVQYIPTYLMKVGDGSSKFNSLSWLSAPASDVYDWAKKASINDVDLSTHGTISSIQAAIDSLKYDVEDSGTGFVTAVTQADGKISVTKKTITVSDISDIAANYAAKSVVDDHEERIAELEALTGTLSSTITGAMHFVGITTTNPLTDGATVTDVTTFAKGDVVIYQVAAETKTETVDGEDVTTVVTPAHDIEFVNLDGNNTTSSWVELGDVTDEQRRLSELEAVTGSHETSLTEQDARISSLYEYLTNDGSTLPDVLILDCGGVN